MPFPLSVRSAAVAAAAVVLLSAFPAMAGEVKMLPEKIYDVQVTDGTGVPPDYFSPGDDAYFTVNFGLAISDVDDYPVAVTIIIGLEGSGRETTVEAFNGQLREGFWQVTEKVGVRSEWAPSIPYKVITKARVFVKRRVEVREGGEERRSIPETTSFYHYYKAEGTLRVGRQ